MIYLIGLLILLLIPSVFYTTRFFCIKKNLGNTKNELNEIIHALDANRIIKSVCPNKDYEDFLVTLNQYLLINGKERVKYLNREIAIRREIENVSHDLRTPLTSILGYLELIDKSTLNKEEKSYLEVVINKAKSLQKLIGGFYELSRLEADEYTMELKEVNIHKMISELMLNSYTEFTNKNINITMDIGDKEVNVLGDEDALERVFSNLIHNVLKYANVRLRIIILQENDYVLIKFINDAEHISETEVSRMFERFYMKDVSRTNQSSGLGLTITRLLVHKMGGSICAELNKEKDLEMIIRLKI